MGEEAATTVVGDRAEAMAAGERAALAASWGDAVERLTQAWLLGAPGAALALCRARLSLVRELAPDPLEPVVGAVARYVQQAQRLEAALEAFAPEDRQQAIWAAEATAETRRRIFDQLRFARVRALGPRRTEALRTLQELFLLGAVPAPPPDGRYHGGMLALSPGYGLDGITQAAAGRVMPWRGKVFDAAAERGENVFRTWTRPLARLLWPGYLGMRDDGPGVYRAFQFRTGAGAALFDPGLTVLKIDYNLPDNPRAVRRVLDEVVQLGEGVLLGKAHLRDLAGRWRTVAWFALRPE